MAKQKEFKVRGSFTEQFWKYSEQKNLEGIFKGFIEKKIDGEERKFAIIEVEGEAKPFLCGGRDLLNKLSEDDTGKLVQIKFEGKETFTPKGTKKKVPINRFFVAVQE